MFASQLGEDNAMKREMSAFWKAGGIFFYSNYSNEIITEAISGS